MVAQMFVQREIEKAVTAERDRCIEAVKTCASWDTNGYICTKDAAIKAILAKQNKR